MSFEQKRSTNECTLKFLCDLFVEMLSKEITSLSRSLIKNGKKKNRVLAIEFVILGHVLFPKNLIGVDIKLLHF